MAESPRAKALKEVQLLSRLQGSDDNGYCRCYTCGSISRFTEMDGGHFIDKSIGQRWAFDVRVIRPQCKICNNSSNSKIKGIFERKLREEHGDDFIDLVIAEKNEIRHMSKSDYTDLSAYFREQIRAERWRIGC